MQTLDVINQCLASMGEVPLNSLSDPHAFKGAATSTLTQENRRIQARGWWFNMELLTLSPNVSGVIQLPNDCIELRTENRSLVQRGAQVYNLVGGTNIFTGSIDVLLIRLLALEDLPESAAQYIAAAAVYKFQSGFDADNSKRQELKALMAQAYIDCNTEHIRNRRSNLLTSNPRIMRLKHIAMGVRNAQYPLNH